MPLAEEQMKGGFSAQSVKALGGEVDGTITSAGSTISDATALTNSINILTTVTTAEGVQLANMEIADSQLVYNDTVTECLVYPPSATYAINQIAVGSAHVLAGFTTCIYHKISTTQIVAMLSA